MDLDVLPEEETSRRIWDFGRGVGPEDTQIGPTKRRRGVPS